MTNDTIPNIQFGNSQNNYQTEKPLQNDALNVPAVIAGEPVDTDDFRELNTNSEIQAMMDELVSADTVGQDEIKRQIEVANECIDMIYQLSIMQKRIAARGMSHPDYVTLETICPGILSSKPSTESYTYRPSKSNQQYSQEAIVDKMRALADKAAEGMQKLITYIIERVRKFNEVLQNKAIKQLAAKYRVTRTKPTDILSIDDWMKVANADTDYVLRRLERCHIDRVATVLKVDKGEVVNSIKGIKTGSSPVQIVTILGHIPKASVPPLLDAGTAGIIETIKLITAKVNKAESILKEVKKATGDGDHIKTNDEDKSSDQKRVGKRVPATNLVNVFQLIEDAEGYTKGMNQYVSMLTKLDRDMKDTWRSIVSNPEAAVAVKPLRAKLYDVLRDVQVDIDNINDAVKAAVGIGFFVNALSSGGLTKKGAMAVKSLGVGQPDK